MAISTNSFLKKFAPCLFGVVLITSSSPADILGNTVNPDRANDFTVSASGYVTGEVGETINYNFAAPSMSFSVDQTARISFLTAYSFNTDPKYLGVGIYGNIVEDSANVPDINNTLINFFSPTITTSSTGGGTLYTAKFPAFGIFPEDIQLPNSTTPYWAVYTTNDPTLDESVSLRNAQLQLGIEPYLGVSATITGTEILGAPPIFETWKINSSVAVETEVDYLLLPVPEPSTLGLVAFGTLGIILLVRRRAPA